MNVPEQVHRIHRRSTNIDRYFTWLRTFVAVSIFIGGMLVTITMSYFIAPYVPIAYQLPLLLFAQSLFMVTAYFIYSRYTNTPALSWSFSLRHWVFGTLLVLLIFSLTALSERLLGIKAEPFMQALFNNQSTSTIAVICMSIVIGAPISEELGIRYFLMEAFPFRKSTAWACLAVLATSALFTLLHTQYENVTTYVQILFIGVLMGYYRITTGGILLPIILHAEADILGLLMFT